MRMRMRNPSLFCAFLFVVVFGLNQSPVVVCNLDPCKPIPASDKEIIKFSLNIIYLVGEFFLNGALGKGIDEFDPNLANGGPPPIGAQRANLDPLNRRIIEEFGYQKLAQLRYLKEEGEIIQRPLIDLSKELTAKFAEQALGRPLRPPFDPYANTLNFYLTMNCITYSGLVGIVGVAPDLNLRKTRELFAGFLGVDAGQNTVARAYLYRRAKDIVVPYNITVAEFVNRTSTLSNQLGKCGIKEEGIEVPRFLGAAGLTESNILSANNNSVSYSRTAQEIMRILYGTGDKSRPGAYFPNGANGNIARSFLKN